MDRHEIIAALDAEIERLQNARQMVIQSAFEKRSPVHRKHRATAGKRAVATAGKRTAAPDRRPIEQPRLKTAPVKEEKQVLITRIPPKEAPKRRHVQTATKQKEWTALSGQVPHGPIAVAANNRPKVVQAENRPADPTSAFGLAVARELTSLGT